MRVSLVSIRAIGAGASQEVARTTLRIEPAAKLWPVNWPSLRRYRLARSLSPNSRREQPMPRRTRPFCTQILDT